jgi:carboxymethylenebutenolidase
MTSRWIDITANDAGKFSGYLALPPAGTGPGIVLIQEIWGVNEHIRAVADQYASAGYVVLAPDVFWRMQPRVDLQYDEEGTGKAFGFYQKLDFAQAAQDVASTIETLRGLPEVTGKTGVVGFCLGGQLAYRAAPIGKADAAVAYYGGGIDQHLDVAGSVTMPIVFHYAEADQHIPQTAVQAVKQAFEGKSNATFFDYPETDHGFNCWGRPTMYNQRAAALAHGRTLEFFSRNL